MRKLALLLLILVATLVDKPRSVYACTPPAFAWFSETLTPDLAQLPDNFSFRYGPDTLLIATDLITETVYIQKVDGTEEMLPPEGIGRVVFADYLFGWQDQMRYGDTRPADIELPPKLAIQLKLQYAKQSIVIPVEVTYSLNPTYQTSAEFCKPFQEQLLPSSESAAQYRIGGAMCLGMLAIGVIAGLVIVLRQK